jgi:hypothetical protein
VEPVKGQPEAIKVRRLPDGGTHYSSSTGVMQTHDLGRGVILHIRSGTMDLAFARRAREHCEQQIQYHGRCVLMVDGYLTKMHTTEFRELMTRWFTENEQAVVHMLVKSPMVQMALNVANLVMGARRAHTYLQVSDWEEVARKEVPGFTRRQLATD